ncbi:MAG: hypothetical protein M1819_003592 [Sarea resinae]|nr:MAG: hypothetical protein M1819_003592 [Sarea resinae]
MALLKPDGTPLISDANQILGNGTNGLVLKCGAHALKAPKIRDTSILDCEMLEDQLYVNEVNIATLETEKAVYKRVGRCDGIADCIASSEEGILLVYYKRGDAATFLEREKELGWSVKARWILSVMQAVSQLHRAKLLIYDIALRNFLVADDGLSLRMIDFGQCSLFPLDTADITAVSDNGLTAQVDLFHLGSTIYSIAVWKRYENDLLNHEFQLPPIKDLPDVGHLPCGDIIKKCWTGRYRDAGEVYSEAQQLFRERRAATISTKTRILQIGLILIPLITVYPYMKPFLFWLKSKTNRLR